MANFCHRRKALALGPFTALASACAPLVMFHASISPRSLPTITMPASGTDKMHFSEYSALRDLPSHCGTACNVPICCTAPGSPVGGLPPGTAAPTRGFAMSFACTGATLAEPAGPRISSVITAPKMSEDNTTLAKSSYPCAGWLLLHGHAASSASVSVCTWAGRGWRKARCTVVPGAWGTSVQDVV